MSLSNEQRAHDLALLSVRAEINRKFISQSNGSENMEAGFDIYGSYYDLYHRSLEAFNLDFPEK